MGTLVAEYDVFAEFYDDFAEGYTDDVNLVLDVAKGLEARTILELCCGTGRCCFVLAELGYEVVGIDLSPKMIEVAERKRQVLNIGSGNPLKVSFYQMNAETFDLPRKNFDMIFSTWSSLQHLDMDGRRKCYGQVFKHLRDGGVFFDDEAIRPVEELNKAGHCWYPPRPVFLRDGHVYFQYFLDTYDETQKIQKRRIYQDCFHAAEILNKGVRLPLDEQSRITFTQHPASRKQIDMDLFQPNMKDNEEALKTAGFRSIEDKCRESKGGAARYRFHIVATK